MRVFDLFGIIPALYIPYSALKDLAKKVLNTGIIYRLTTF